MIAANRILIAGGSGFIGQHMRERWKGKQITIVSRTKHALIKTVTWEDLKKNGAEICQPFDLIINLTGANIGEHRWSEARKQEILQSRIEATSLLRQICETLAEKAPPLFNASAVGVYDLQPSEHAAYTENTVINFDAEPSFLASIARQWEKATWSTKATDLRIVNLRFAVVLASDGGALKKIALPYYFGLGGKIGSGQQIFSWVHVDDLINAVEFIYSHPKLNGPLNIVAPDAVKQIDFARTLASVLHRPAWGYLPSWLVRLMFGEMGQELLLAGQRVYPQKLLQAGFSFQYPTLEKALSSIF